jgi:hypothetical protein
LGNIENLPNEGQINNICNSAEFKTKLEEMKMSPEREKSIHLFAKELLESGNIFEALCVLMSD